MKILTFGDSTHTISGFGTAIRELDTHLHKVGHEVYHIGWQHFGQEIIASFHDKVLGYTELPNIGGHQFGEKALQYWLPKINPDVLITLGDFWMIQHIFKTDMPWAHCAWYPIDGYPITDQMKEMLARIDYRVCLSKYGADLVKAEGINTSYIPHGIDTTIFKPLLENDVVDMKKRLGLPLDATIIGRVDRNQSRKMIPRTMKAFAKLHKEFPNTALLLWMDKVDREGWDLGFCAKRLGLKEGEDIFFPPPDMMANFMYGTSSEELALVMNTMDIHCYLTGGEGFGLTALETMACGAVNVCTDYTTCKEIQGDWTCGLPVKVETFMMGNAGVDRALADVNHAYEQMKYLIQNPNEMKLRGERGVKRAQEVYDIKIVTDQFDKYLRENIGNFSDREKDVYERNTN